MRHLWRTQRLVLIILSRWDCKVRRERHGKSRVFFDVLFLFFLLYQKHKICYLTVSLRGGTFRVKVPQKRGGSDSPAPLNGLGFHPKTPRNNQIIQTTEYRNIFQTKTENKPFAEKLTFAERVKGKALVV